MQKVITTKINEITTSLISYAKVLAQPQLQILNKAKGRFMFYEAFLLLQIHLCIPIS